MNEATTKDDSSNLSGVMPRPLRRIYLAVRNEVMVRGGLQPRKVYWYSRSGRSFEDATSHRTPVPNIVGYYHHAMVQFIRVHGLGKRCLLVSESIRVKHAMSEIYPGIEFVCCDLFPELMEPGSGKAGTDALWDVCLEPPPELRSGFSSLLCHALLEHVIDPTTALRNMLSLLDDHGKLFLMTHTPSFHKHSIPRDYCRFHHDYFEDLPAYMARFGMTIELEELYSKEGIIVGAYSKV